MSAPTPIHIGLSTVTYLFAGAIRHRDSLGFDPSIRPGEVNWMTVGAAPALPGGYPERAVHIVAGTVAYEGTRFGPGRLPPPPDDASERIPLPKDPPPAAR